MSSTEARQALPDRRTMYLQEHPAAAPLGFTVAVDLFTLQAAALVGYTGTRVTAIAAAGAADAAGITDPAPYVVDVTTDVDGALTITGHTAADTDPLDGVTRHTLPDLLHLLNAAPATLGGAA
jgi:aconitase B